MGSREAAGQGRKGLGDPARKSRFSVADDPPVTARVRSVLWRAHFYKN